MRSDEELAAVRIGPPEILNSQIRLDPYSEDWPRLYERDAARIRATLSDRVLLLEHVGSTSVSGLSAKPRIDILLGVADSSDEPAYVPPMESAGYVLRIRETEHEHRLFKGPDTDINLHVHTVGCSEIERLIKFRDRLRSNEADRLLYERTKQELAQRTWKFTQHYADAKSAVVEEIIARAGGPARDSHCELY